MRITGLSITNERGEELMRLNVGDDMVLCPGDGDVRDRCLSALSEAFSILSRGNYDGGDVSVLVEDAAGNRRPIAGQPLKVVK